MHRTIKGLEIVKINQTPSDRPTVYADLNVFRYVALGELEITNADEFLWVYSTVHLDEIARGGNRDALDGMRKLKAVEIYDVLTQTFESSGNIALRQYADPCERYRRHLEAISGYETISDHMVEHLLRIFGADNFPELSLSPEALRNEVERLTEPLPTELRKELVGRANEVSIEMGKMIDTHLTTQRPVDETRLAFGITSSARENAAASTSPIDAIWSIIQSSSGNAVSKDQFFGFEPHPAAEGVPHSQHGALAGAHMVLNLLGISPDRGLAKRAKIKNIISDGQHVGMASYCTALLSADTKFCNKAHAIYRHIGSQTSVLWFPYDPKGVVIRLDAKEA